MKAFILCIVICIYAWGSNIQLTKEQQEYLNTKQVIKMCVDPDWEPFEKINKDGKHEGLANDLIQLVANRLGISIKLLPTKDWEESLAFSKEHKCDILSFLNQTPKREEWLVFSDILFSDPNVLVGRSDRDYIDDISKEKLSIALPKGTSIAERFAKDFPNNLTIIPTVTEDEAFKLVEEYKADITLRSMIVTAYTIKKNGIFNLKIIGQPKGYENNLRIGVRKDEPILRDILNLGIKTITEDDTNAIINKHVTIVVNNVTNLAITAWVLIGLFVIILIAIFWNYLLSKKVKHEVAKNMVQQELLIQQQRKAELGGMVANISHQWKNALNKISANNLELMIKSQYQNRFHSNEITNYTNSIEHSIKFMSQTMNVFLNFYKDSDTKEVFDIKDSIDDALKIIDIKIKTTNTTININDKNHQVEALRNEWIHIWLNIINNAINASTKKSTENPILDITILDNCVCIKDNCGGFDTEVLESVNNNNYTKGLGIQMTKDILKKYKYNLTISNIENGSEIRILKE